MFISVYQVPEESYSRQLDNKVAATEMPYGYDMSPPPAGTSDYDMEAKEQHYGKKKSKGGY